MDEKFLDAMVNKSMDMMASACGGKTLTKDEVNFILTTQKLCAAQKKQDFLPNLVKGASGFLPLLTSFLGGA